VKKNDTLKTKQKSLTLNERGNFCSITIVWQLFVMFNSYFSLDFNEFKNSAYKKINLVKDI